MPESLPTSTTVPGTVDIDTGIDTATPAEPLPVYDAAAEIARIAAASLPEGNVKALARALRAEVLAPVAAALSKIAPVTNEAGQAVGELGALVNDQGRHIAAQDATITAQGATIEMTHQAAQNAVTRANDALKKTDDTAALVAQLVARVARLEATPPPVEEPDPDPPTDPVPLPAPPPVLSLALHQHGRETDPIHATWADARAVNPANPFDCFDVEVSRDGSPQPSLAACVTSPEHHVPLPVPGARYGVRVRAHRSARDGQPEALGPWSAEVFIVAYKAPVVDPDPEPDPDPVPVPPDPSLPPVTVTAIEPGEDYLLVRFAPVAGAVDYAVSDPDHPGMTKASAGLPVVEWPDAKSHPPKRLTVQALASPLPYQRPTRAAGVSLVNGHGAKDAPMPKVLAQATVTLPASAVVRPHPERANGATFLDLDIPGQHRTLFQETPLPAGWERRDPSGNVLVASAQDEHYRLSHPNGRTHLICVATNRRDTFAAIDHGHLEVAVYDGGTPPAAVGRNNYSAATLVDASLWRPLAPGGVIRFGIRMNPTHTGRRWVEVGLRKRGAPVIFPNRTREAVSSWYPIPPQFGDMVRVVIDSGDQGQGGYYAHYVTPHPDGSGRWSAKGAVPANPFDWQAHGETWRTNHDRNNLHINRNTWSGPNPDAGTDIGSDFEMEFSETGARLFERSAFDGKEYALRGSWPAGVKLPVGEYEIYVTFMMYHSSLEEQELRASAPYFDQFLRNMNDHHLWHLRNLWINDRPRLPVSAAPGVPVAP